MNTHLPFLQAHLPPHLDAALITSPVGRRYYLGLSSTAGTLVVTRTDAFLLIDGRYREEIERLSDAVNLLPAENPNALPDLIARLDVKTLGVETGHLTLAAFERLKRRLPGCTLDTNDALQSLILAQRRHKSPKELALLRKAQHASDLAYQALLNFIRPGRTEREVALELYRLCRTQPGVESAHTDLVLAGPNGSRPHGMASDRPIQSGEFLTMDFGAVVEGYYADMTRTVAVGTPTDEMRLIYDTVRTAKDTATAAIAPGLLCRDIDWTARKVIEDAGYGDAFCHGLGHSIGLEGHEDPRFRADSTAAVETGLVMSVEPGIYLPGRLGVRIEDLIYVSENGPENINLSPTELVVLS